MEVSQNNQLSQRIFRTWKRNPLAIGSSVVLVGLILIALLGYVIAPDQTPNADAQIAELHTVPPGFTIQLLQVPLDPTKHQQRTGNWWSGYPATHQQIPVKNVQRIGDSIILERYMGENNSQREALHQHVLGKRSLEQSLVQRTYLLGTDKLGRCVLSRLILGTRVSLTVGIFAVIISWLIGLSLGLWAGYQGGWVDRVVQWLIQVTWSIPTILLVVAITLTLGKGYTQLLIAIGLTMWVSVARLVRGQVLSWKERPFVQAAQVLGYSHQRIVLHHILPNLVGPLLVLSSANFAAAIMVEAGLSFLGAGVQPPQPSWGLMMKEHYAFIITSQPSLAIIPGIAMMVLVLSINVLANMLRDAVYADGNQ